MSNRTATMTFGSDRMAESSESVNAYFVNRPDVDDPDQLVSLEGGGHGGAPAKNTYTESHVLAVIQSICDYRSWRGITGPLFLGRDDHCLSAVAERSALEVLAANGVQVALQKGDGFAPAPVISHAILAHNRNRASQHADGIVLSVLQKRSGVSGLKYNLANGGQADSAASRWIEDRANEYLLRENAGVFRTTVGQAPAVQVDFMRPYVEDLRHTIDMAAIRNARLRIGVDSWSGVGELYWQSINETYGFDIVVINQWNNDRAESDAGLDRLGDRCLQRSGIDELFDPIELNARFDLAITSDPIAESCVILSASGGRLNSNQFLPLAIEHLLRYRKDWPNAAVVGKSIVGSWMIDRVVRQTGREIREVPFGFHWLAPGLFDGACCFGADECAGGTFARSDGSTWTTDKDGIVMALLALEILAVTGEQPRVLHRSLADRFGEMHYACRDCSIDVEEKTRLRDLSSTSIEETRLVDMPIVAKQRVASASGDSNGGMKVVGERGWFVVLPSRSEDSYRMYAESTVSEEHLEAIVEDAQRMIQRAMKM